MPRKKPIDKLSDWEWTTLVAAWRYYENRHTIISATFPADIVSHFFTGRYSNDACMRIAHQFAITDHGARGEEDWTRFSGSMQCDTLPWTRFYRFCEGYVNGFHSVELGDGERRFKDKAFYVEWNDTWYPVKEYIKHPSHEIFCPPDFIVSIDGIPFKKGGKE